MLKSGFSSQSDGDKSKDVPFVAELEEDVDFVLGDELDGEEDVFGGVLGGGPGGGNSGSR
jgi:hypothetical protein